MKFKSIALIITFAVLATFQVSAYNQKEFVKHAKAIPDLMTQLSEQQIDEIIAQGEEAANDYLLTKVAEYMLQEFPNVKKEANVGIKDMDNFLFGRKDVYGAKSHYALFQYVLPLVSLMDIEYYFIPAVTKYGWGKDFSVINIFNNPTVKGVLGKKQKDIEKNPQLYIDQLKSGLKEVMNDIIANCDLNSEEFRKITYLKDGDKTFTLNLDNNMKYVFSKDNKSILVDTEYIQGLLEKDNNLDFGSFFYYVEPYDDDVDPRSAVRSRGQDYYIDPQGKQWDKKTADSENLTLVANGEYSYKKDDIKFKIQIEMNPEASKNIILYSLSQKNSSIENALIRMYLTVNDYMSNYDGPELSKMYLLENSKVNLAFDEGYEEEGYRNQNYIISSPRLDNVVAEIRKQKEISKAESEKKKVQKEKKYKENMIKRANQADYVGLVLGNLIDLEEWGYIRGDGYDAHIGENGGYLTIINKNNVKVRVRINGLGQVVGQRRLN